MRITVDIVGEDVLRKKLAALGTIAKGEVIKAAVEAGGRVLEAEAKIRAPVDLGFLRNSITVRPGEITANSANVHVGPAAHYGPYLEFGTGIYAEDGNGRRTPWRYFSDRLQRWVTTRGSPAQPYLRPALISRRSQIVEAIMITVRRLINLAVRS